ncbi:MAG: glycosyltransferase family 1 protein [Gammaproteobacteria bacterium]|nr:glycosyltransferase family 1 protein [Gammaproteobacteria bacterium]
MKLLLITDAWEPQTNGVVTTYKNVIHELQKTGLEVQLLHPGCFRNIPLPGYNEIPLSLNLWSIGRHIKNSAADFIHVAVEGPLGLAARHYLKRKNFRFTTSFHTRFPEYINKRYPFISIKAGYKFMHWFHRPSSRIMVTTRSMKTDLQQYGFENMTVWGRGVDTELFKPNGKMPGIKNEPVFLYAGRIAVEKNVEDFLMLDLPGRKVIVGDGPSRVELENKYPQVEFVGYKYGAELASYFANADVFVFPSRTDTFGLVMLEAMACGTPTAAYPVTGPIDVVNPGVTGYLNEDLKKAALAALSLDRNKCRKHAEQCSWSACANKLRECLVPANSQNI